MSTFSEFMLDLEFTNLALKRSMFIHIIAVSLFLIK